MALLVVFIVHLDPGRESDDFLSEEVVSETQAKVMTTAEAANAGFSGMPDDPNIRLVTVPKRERGFMRGALERAHDVVGFDAQEVQG